MFNMVNEFKNCYFILNKHSNELTVCHYDEIAYFKIRQYNDLTIYTPVLKNNEYLFSDVNKTGHKQYIDYINYKNGISNNSRDNEPI